MPIIQDKFPGEKELGKKKSNNRATKASAHPLHTDTREGRERESCGSVGPVIRKLWRDSPESDGEQRESDDALIKKKKKNVGLKIMK